MTSLRKLEANRRNACASTGPRSAKGKAKSARNARRHGLTIPIDRDPMFGPAAKALADHIMAGNTDPKLIALARRIAEAQIEVVRVREARCQLLKPAFTWGTYHVRRMKPERLAQLNREVRELQRRYPDDSQIDWEAERLLRGEPCPEKLAYVLWDLSGDLSRMDRYETRAIARRDTAIRAFDAARMRRLANEQSPSGAPSNMDPSC